MISKVIKPFKEVNEYLIKEIKESGVFLSKNNDNFPKSIPQFGVNVEFYQKRYHNFPLKQNEHLTYRFLNVDDLLSAPLKITDIKIEPRSRNTIKITKV